MASAKTAKKKTPVKKKIAAALPRMSPDTKAAAKLTASLSKHMAEVLVKGTMRLADGSPEGALARAKVFHFAGYFEDAADSYAEAMASEKSGDEAAARLAIVQLISRQPEKALATATELATRNPEFDMPESTSNRRISALTILGDALASSGRLEEAIAAYQRARKTSSKDVGAAGRLAQLYLVTGDPSRALALEKDVAANPRYRHLSEALAAGRTDPGVLRAYAAKGIESILAVTVHGRPMIVDETAVVAPLIEGDAQWCGDVD